MSETPKFSRIFEFSHYVIKRHCMGFLEHRKILIAQVPVDYVNTKKNIRTFLFITNVIFLYWGISKITVITDQNQQDVYKIREPFQVIKG